MVIIKCAKFNCFNAIDHVHSVSIYCNIHKRTKRLCLAENCDKVSSYGYLAGCKYQYCADHKLKDMIHFSKNNNNIIYISDD